MNFLIRYKYALIVLALLLLGLWLRVRLAQDHYVHKWDERFHALVAKNMVKHPLKPTLYEVPLLEYDYTKWYSNHVWLHKQPLPLWLIAASYTLFGTSDFATRIPTLLLSLFSIYITYLLGSHLFGRKTGLLAAFFMAINGLVIEMGAGRIATDHYDTIFMVFIEIADLLDYYNSSTKKSVYAFFSGLLIGMAILTKWLPALIVFALHYCFLKGKQGKPTYNFKQIAISVLACVAVALPWQLYILNYYPAEAKWEYYNNWLHLSQELEGQTGGYFYFLDKIRINYSEIVYLPLIYLVFTLLKEKLKDSRFVVLFVWIFIPILFFSLAKTKMQGYVLFICPALFLLTAHFFFELKDNWLKKISQKWLKIFSILLLISIIVLPIRYSIERTAFGFTKPKHENYVDVYKSLNNTLPERALVLNVKEPIEFMFYSNSVAYSTPEIPSDKADSILKLGYEIFYLDEVNGQIQKVKKDISKTNSPVSY